MDSSALKHISTRYGDLRDVKLLGGFDNNVYEAKLGSREVVVKILPYSDSVCQATLGEMDWVTYLSDNGVRVPKPVLSAGGSVMEKVESEDSTKLVIISEKVKGAIVDPRDPNVWNQELFKKWGAVIGRMHLLAKQAKPHASIVHWHQAEIFQIADLEGEVEKAWLSFQQELKALSVDKDGYGIIHNDLHQQNLFINDGELTVIDFGDCEYGWFAYDIAISLYHAVQTIPSVKHQERVDFAHMFMASYLEGYANNNSLDGYWLSKIPFFLNWRQLFSYIYLTQHLDLATLEAQTRDAIAGLGRKAEGNLPYLEGFSL